MGPADLNTASTQAAPPTNPTRKVAAASLIGTTIEFYDFYVYATAAVLVFGPLFFPSGNETAQTLASLATFAIAFVARPIGSVVFGHFGDRIGRKTTLVAALLVMGISTVLIGVLPTHATAGNLAPVLLCLLRFGQGFGLGGEWGGAALLATENAPANRRALYGMFPQLGAPFGFVLANGLFIVLATTMSDETFTSWGWRIPFLLSAVLVLLGLWIRLSLAETPVFAKALAENKQVRVPVAETFRSSWRIVVLGAFSVMLTYTLFYLTTTWSLSYGTKALAYERQDFLLMLCVAVLFMAAATPLSGWLSDRFGRRPVLATAMVGGAVVGLLTGPLLGSGETPLVMLWLCAGLFFMGLVFGPIGAYLPELFPTNVRYTGASLAFNSGSILGASLAPYTAVKLATAYGVSWVGFYLAATAVVSLIALSMLRETRTASLT
ncbi:MFS transporter [Kineococcus radiotolerans]|uniref:Putative proline/betaine transporter n=1 Tax=Kineococcus radiotolerans (strain ATCC BAA-149 / DSM 14245 / SRS30216) TaxID=266940 RepID=A6WD44_KINRD|nr:MFS transporter [Kineococcus radiotolerans]ABS04733.1 major facilitator superfamily MFS_1 [Kineococcus radiotolerans SRS30216 = ATCC BAA-149]